MATYYYVSASKSPIDGEIANLGNTKENEIPDRPRDFPMVPKIPFAEEARIQILGDLFAQWSYALQLPILVRANDDGSIEAWAHEEVVTNEDE